MRRAAEPVEAVVVGAGQRGRAVFGRYALDHPERLRIVGLAEPEPTRRAAMASAHGLAPECVFEDFRALFEGPRLAPVAIIATADALHLEPTLLAFEAGHDVLLEKPMALRPEECLRLVEAGEASGCRLQVGHVLRYTPFYMKVAELLAEGALGRLVHLDLREHVSRRHLVHSYVRGKFRSSGESAPILLAKACHDLDLLAWFGGADVGAVSSFGSLLHFGPAGAPAGVPGRCTDGCPVQEACPDDAVGFYLGPDDAIARLWPFSDLGLDPSREARGRALEAGPYGRCVYRSDNDVMDHQVVALVFEGGATASFALHGFAAHERRTLRITGTEGELRGVLQEGILELERPGVELRRFEIPGNPLDHYGGDAGLLADFTEVLTEPGRALRASGRSALTSHLLGFAAEEARRTGRVVDFAGFCAAIVSRD
jgi:predicted dehydrogenase